MSKIELQSDTVKLLDILRKTSWRVYSYDEIIRILIATYLIKDLKEAKEQ